MKTKLVISFLLGTLFYNSTVFSQAHLFDTVSLSISVEPKNNFIPNAEKPAAEDMFDVTVKNQVLNITTHLETPFTVELTSHKLHKRFVLGPFIKQCYHVLPAGGTYSLDIKYNDIIFSGTFDILMTQQEALDIILKTYQWSDVEVHLSNWIYAKGDTLHLSPPRGYFIADYDAWVAFIDLYPNANWGHPCQYILINAVSGDTVVYNSTTTLLREGWDFTYLYRNGVKNEMPHKTMQDVFRFVNNMYLDQEVALWVGRSYYIGGLDKIELRNGEYIAAPNNNTLNWLAIVDTHPDEQGEHSREYFFILPHTQEFVHIEKNDLPLDFEKDFILMRGKPRIESHFSVVPKAKKEIIAPKKSMLSDSAPVDPPYNPTNSKWAIIISGGQEPLRNYPRYWNNCSAVYKTLINHGYDSDHIFIAISDGLDDANDYLIVDNRPDGESIYGNSSWDLDADGIDEEIYPATYNGITRMFEDAQYAMENGDDVFIFTTDHGDTIGNHSIIRLWNNEYILDYAFVGLITDLNPGKVAILMEQCNSGGFIDDIQYSGLDSVVITTACAAEQLSAPMASNEYDEFVYHWLTAINGISPDNTIIADADYNYDGYISMQEAYIYACTHKTQVESPQIYSNNDCMKYSITLTDLLSECTGPEIVTGIYDIYIKDNAADFGAEPNVSTNNSWISTDIWFENPWGGKVDILVQGHTYRVCARVHNRGDHDSPGGEYIFWHWTKSTIGSSWPYSWFDDYYYWCGDNQIPRGGLINPYGTPLPSIPKGESAVVFTNWTVPFIDYSSCSDFADDIDNLWHYCVLARIVDSQAQPGENRQEYPLSNFILESNNVASSNFSIINGLRVSVNDLPSAFVGIAALNMTHDLYHLYCDVSSPIIESGCLFITLSPEMYDYWTPMGTGFIDLNEHGKIEITNNHAELQYFDIPGDAFYPTKIEIDTTLLPFGELVFDLYLVNSYNDSIIGGERFVYYNGHRINSAQNHQYLAPFISETLDLQILCIPNPAHDNVFVRTGNTDDYINIRIYDLQGQCVLTSSTPYINIEQLSNGIYCLSVQTQQGMQQTILLKQ